MVRADVFNGFFCGFDSCGSAAFPDFRGGASSRPPAAKAVRTNSSILRHVGKFNASPRLRRVSATKSYGVFGAKRNSRFRKIWFEPMFFRNVVISERFSDASKLAA